MPSTLSVMSTVPPAIRSTLSEWMPSSPAAIIRSPLSTVTWRAASMASEPAVRSSVPPSIQMTPTTASGSSTDASLSDRNASPCAFAVSVPPVTTRWSLPRTPSSAASTATSAAGQDEGVLGGDRVGGVGGHRQRAVAGDPQVGTREQRRVGGVLDRLVHCGPRCVGEHVVAAVGEPDHDLVGLDHVDRRHIDGGDVHAVEHEVDHPVGGVDDERAGRQRAADAVGAGRVDRDGVPVDAHTGASLGRTVGQGEVDGVSHVEGQVRLIDVQVRVAHLGDGGGHR